MASEEPVHPLRLSKNEPMSSPPKMASSIPRPLSEISPTEKRRNSPSWNQSTKQKMPQTDSSPFQSSPLDGTTSPRLFWQNRNLNSENSPFAGRSGSPSPTRRPSVERLQKASRVKNSNILALEHKNDYDPLRVPQVERPLAKVQANAYGGAGVDGQRVSEKRVGGLGHHRNHSKTNLALSASRPVLSPPPQTPTKENTSPIKSSLSLSRFKSSFDPETGAWSADESGDECDLPPEGRALHRQQKSVTFDAAPPQVNEYEMATPDLSSIGSNSREGSYESEDDDDDDDGDEHYMFSHRGEDQDDSFDASLEDTDKTPVVGPDDWRQASHDQYSQSPMPDDEISAPMHARPPQHKRTDSSNSSGDHRPLPPLPGASGCQLTRSDSTASNGLSATAERMLGARRSLPSPPPASATKFEIQNIGNTKMTLEERLRLMMLSDDGKTAAEQQRERRMRRAGTRGDRVESQTPERETQSPSVQTASVYDGGEEEEETGKVHQNDNDDDDVDLDDELEDTIGDISGLGDFQMPPRISRESILRRVNGNIASLRDSDYNFSSPPPGSSPERQLPYDPDVPLPSTEDSILDEAEDDEVAEDGESSVIVKQDVDEPDIDLYSIPEMYQCPEARAGSLADKEEQIIEDDGDSQYSEIDLPQVQRQETEEDQTATPRAASPANNQDFFMSKTADALGDSLGLSTSVNEEDFAKSFQSYMLPEPARPDEKASEEKVADLPEEKAEAEAEPETVGTVQAERVAAVEVQRPRTPQQQLLKKSLSKPEYDGTGWGEPEEGEEQEQEQEQEQEREQEYDEPGTPESVIHHPVEPEYEDDEDNENDNDDGYVDEIAGRISPPVIPERLATIKSASGSKLKTRPSATPSDLEAMREARRQVSREIPGVPPIPERHRDHRISRDVEAELTQSSTDDYMERHPSFKKRSLTLDLDLGLSLDQDFDRVIEAQKVHFQFQLQSRSTKTTTTSTHTTGTTASAGACADATNTNTTATPNPQTTHTTSQAPARQASTQEEQTAAATESVLNNANVTSRKQRGYLMRQNTKLVAASDKDSDDPRSCRSAGNSPVKAARPQSWTVEPWNPQTRRRSVRTTTNTKPLARAGAVPPLPGLESNLASAVGTGTGTNHNHQLATTAEEDVAADMGADESGERGRLFVKVMGVKDLDLPVPKNERTWFSLTLDNGVHCVTTAWLELARNAPIGQEFELVVPNDLEFQLTLNVKLEKPAVTAPKKMASSPTKSSRPKTSTFSRVFASPKKRREMEMRQREEDDRLAREQREAAMHARQQLNTPPSAWDLLSPLVAADGSFARAYVCLKEHEARCFGRPYLVEVAAFNEWAAEEAAFASSVKSKRGAYYGASSNSMNGSGGNTNQNGGAGGAGAGAGDAAVMRRAPYKIGKLELQLLFVPRPKGTTAEDMPKSMNSCVREMKAAEERLARSWEGPLSQQGGDCPYWRRRYFKLVGTKLTAYHEATRQPRATINLANAKRLIDDRQTLTEKETTGKGGKRRRSAFAEEEEGYMFVEEGFRIRFNNGEVIDFYADSTRDKDGWMKVLAEVIGRDSLGSVTGSLSDDDGGAGARARGKWCELVLKREEALRKRAEGRRVHSRTKSMYV